MQDIKYLTNSGLKEPVFKEEVKTDCKKVVPKDSLKKNVLGMTLTGVFVQCHENCIYNDGNGCKNPNAVLKKHARFAGLDSWVCYSKVDSIGSKNE